MGLVGWDGMRCGNDTCLRGSSSLVPIPLWACNLLLSKRKGKGSDYLQILDPPLPIHPQSHQLSGAVLQKGLLRARIYLFLFTMQETGHLAVGLANLNQR